MVIGTVSTGKSTLLQTVVYSLVSCYTPELLNIYCLDFSAKLLSVFSGRRLPSRAARRISWTTSWLSSSTSASS